MKTILTTVLLFLYILRPTYAGERPCQRKLIDMYPVNDIKVKVDQLSFAVANASWTHEDAYEGEVIIFSARVHGNVNTDDLVDEDGYRTQYYMASIDTEGQVGSEGVEHTYLHVTAITREKVRELQKDGKIHLIKKGVEVGNMQISRDLPLAQDRYIEAEPVKIYGTVGWSPNSNSELELLARVSLSLGYAHGRSTKPAVSDTNNIYVGQDYGLSLKHQRFGQIDFSRGIDGEITKYNPNSTSSREAYVKLGYTYNIDEKTSITFAGEKRSFRFGADYEKSRRYLITYSKRF